MYKERRIAVVVPAYNEARHVGGVLAAVPAYVDHVIAVDDCSTDETASVTASTGDARALLLRTPENQGGGGATVLGYRKALELGCDVTAKMDGDGQMSPAHLNLLLDALREQGEQYGK